VLAVSCGAKSPNSRVVGNPSTARIRPMESLFRPLRKSGALIDRNRWTQADFAFSMPVPQLLRSGRNNGPRRHRHAGCVEMTIYQFSSKIDQRYIAVLLAFALADNVAHPRSDCREPSYRGFFCERGSSSMIC
jgi:hypothetical protein